MTEPSAPRKPPRVIHIVESLDTGAVESWLLRMLEAGHRFGEALDWTFYSVLSRPGRFDERARELGATVINSPVELDDKVSFARHLRQALRAGSYDVMHCHHDVVSAVYLAAAVGLPIRRRIVHVHNADLVVPTASPRKAAALREPMRRLCLMLADRIVGISRYTLANFLRGRPTAAGRDVVLYYGIDTAPFHVPLRDPASLRQSISVPQEARILLFVGRMVDYKNPLFVVEMLAEIAEAEPNAYAVFVGAGPLAGDVLSRAQQLGVGDRVRMLGWRDDTSALMQLADVFIFPRVEEVSPEIGMEGLGLVVIEAQAAGLVALLSKAIPDDAIVIEDLCKRLSLAAGVKAWGESTRELLARPPLSRDAALMEVERSRFSLDAGFHHLIALHQL